MKINHLIAFSIFFCSFHLSAQVVKDSSFTEQNICWKGKTANAKMTGEWVGQDCKSNKILVVGNYKDGKKIGEEKHFNTLGQKIVIYQYKNGLLDGQTVYFYGNDTLGCVNYTNGIINGEWRICDTTGRTMRFVVWEMGKIKDAFPQIDEFTQNEPPRNYRQYAALTSQIINTEHDEIISQDLIVKSPESEIEANNPIEDTLTITDNMPEFPGGQNALTTYLVNNIKYPDSARKKGKQGIVYVQFVVSKTGVISNVKVLKGVAGGSELNDEAVRVVKQMPAWKPGTKDGKPIAVKMILPIRFMLSGQVPKEKQRNNKKRTD